MSLTLPSAARAYLERLNYDLPRFLNETAARQSSILHFWKQCAEFLPQTERDGLATLAWALAERTLTQPKPSRSVLGNLLEIFIVLDEVAPATELFAQLHSEPTPHNIYYERAVRLALAQNAPDQARQILRDTRQILHLEAEICLYERNWAGALEIYLQWLAESPDSRGAQVRIAEAALKMGQTEIARHALTAMENTELAAPSWSLLHRAARCWHTLGDSERANRLEIRATEAYERAHAALLNRDTEKLRPEEELISFEQPATSFQPETGTNQLTVDSNQSEIIINHQSSTINSEVLTALREVFGHNEFRPGQAEVIGNILAGRDTLAVLPTGAGKSLCYQLPALLLPRPTLVLSPLISLMKDQADKLPPALKKQTLVINSSLDPQDAAAKLRELSRPGSSIKLVYAAPERLRQAAFVRALQRAALGLLVVDEAHCVAMWGNDFRPDYLYIRRVLQDLTETAPVLLAVTATATPEVVAEIGQGLGRDLTLVRGSVFRPNLRFHAEKAPDSEAKKRRIGELCQQLKGCGIVYTRSRDKTEEIAAYLCSIGVRASHYHAGMDKDIRRRTQEGWMNGEYRVIVATIAFGMGIDKPDVRFILHYNPATSLENYVQEAGRAGRDGQPSHCVLLYTSNDKSNITRWMRDDLRRFNLDTLRAVYRAVAAKLGKTRRGIVPLNELLLQISDADETVLRVCLSLLERAELLERGYDLPGFATLEVPLFSAPRPPLLEQLVSLSGFESEKFHSLDLAEIAQKLNIGLFELDTCLIEWHAAGLLRYTPSPRDVYIELKDAGENARERLDAILRTMHTAADRRVETMQVYLATGKCRQIMLARHFGEKLTTPCGGCDNCPKPQSQPEMLSFDDEPTEVELIPPSTESRPQLEVKVPAKSKLPDDNILTAILGAVAHAKKPLARTPLSSLLLGTESAPENEEDNPYYKKLSHLVWRKVVDRHIEKTLEHGLLSRSEATRHLFLTDSGRDWLLQHGFDAALLEAKPATPVAVPLNADFEVNEAILGCLRVITGDDDTSIGRTGLVRILLGEKSALATRANNPYKGCLRDRMRRTQIEKLIDKLVDGGLIEEHETTGMYGMTYQALRVSEAGYASMNK
jgi:RecQ family ATP-dependent DNA helicase